MTLRLEKDGYVLLIFSEACPESQASQNVDIEVVFDDGRRYSGTMFTLAALEALMASNGATGEMASGSYFWCPDLVVVKELSVEVITRCIEDIIRQGVIDSALQALDSTEKLKTLLDL